MTCTEITKSIYRFQEIHAQMDPIFGGQEHTSEKLGKLLPLKKEFDHIVAEIESENGADVVFLEAFNKENVIFNLANWFYGDEKEAFYEFYNSIKVEERVSIRINRRSVERLLASTLDFFEKNAEELLIHDNEEHFTKDNQFKIFQSMVVSVFIKKMIKSGEKLDLRGIKEPIYFMDNFFNYGNLIYGKCVNIGENMESGVITAEHAQGSVGEGMSEGMIKVKTADGFVGSGASGGKIIVGKANSVVSTAAHGGAVTLEEGTGEIGNGSKNAIFVRKAGDSVGAGKSGGVLIVEEAGDLVDRNPIFYSIRGGGQGTLLVTRFKDQHIGESQQVTIRYDEESRMYKEIRSDTEINSQIIRDGSVIKIFKGYGTNLVIIDDMSIIKENPTDGMTGGILVLRDLPQGDLGKNMKNCAVIIEVDKDPEEVKKLIDKDRKPGDGLILMRVPDPDNPDRTKLIDLEE